MKKYYIIEEATENYPRVYVTPTLRLVPSIYDAKTFDTEGEAKAFIAEHMPDDDVTIISKEVA